MPTLHHAGAPHSSLCGQLQLAPDSPITKQLLTGCRPASSCWSVLALCTTDWASLPAWHLSVQLGTAQSSAVDQMA